VDKAMRKKNHGQAMGQDELSTNSAYFSSVWQVQYVPQTRLVHLYLMKIDFKWNTDIQWNLDFKFIQRTVDMKIKLSKNLHE
jgi:hypothetical protein